MTCLRCHLAKVFAVAFLSFVGIPLAIILIVLCAGDSLQ